MRNTLRPAAPVHQGGALVDTAPEAEAILIEAYRRMSPAEKLHRVLDLNASLEALAAARILRQYGPTTAEADLPLRLASLRLDRETMIRVYDWDPEAKGY
jgi:hypothetical protein